MLMNTLKNFLHLSTAISTSLMNSKSGSYTSKDILILLKTEQALHNTHTLKCNCRNQFVESTVLVAQFKSPKSTNIPTCSVCKCPGHTNNYCVMPGGGMAGKTITESIATHKKDRENRKGGGNNSDLR